jgi:hypothetical protein
MSLFLFDDGGAEHSGLATVAENPGDRMLHRLRHRRPRVGNDDHAPHRLNLNRLAKRRTEMNRRTFCQGAILATVALSLPAGAGPVRATLYKQPQCTCCDEYVAYLRKNGFEVDVKSANDLGAISRKAGVPEKFQGCHTMFVEGYVVDGHVPVNVIRKLLSERPAIAGITLPGMPDGSPGMTGRKSGPFTIYAVTKDGAPPKVYATE